MVKAWPCVASNQKNQVWSRLESAGPTGQTQKACNFEEVGKQYIPILMRGTRFLTFMKTTGFQYPNQYSLSCGMERYVYLTNLIEQSTIHGSDLIGKPSNATFLFLGYKGLEDYSGIVVVNISWDGCGIRRIPLNSLETGMMAGG